MTILVKSATDVSVKNKWATNWNCFLDAAKAFRRLTGKSFVLDVAAEPQTAKISRFLLPPNWVEEQSDLLAALRPQHEIGKRLNPVCVGFDALQCDWDDGWWCNPPFDLKFEFIDHAISQMHSGRDGMMLLPYEPLSQWWVDRVEGYATLVLEPDGRYPFYEADGETKKTGVNFGSALVLFSHRGVMTPRERIIRGKWSQAEILEELT